MSKRQHVFAVVLLFICYITFTWQHLLSNNMPFSDESIKLYFAIGLLIFLVTCFFNYLFEKVYDVSHFATAMYILLFLSGAPFLYKLMIHFILNSSITIFIGK